MDITKIKTYPLKKRKSKVEKSQLAKPAAKGTSFKKFYQGLPHILAADNLRATVSAVISSRKNKKPIIFMMGAHVIKCGLSPLIIDLMKKRFITALCLNGAGIIHDFEIAFIGQTSEDVDKAIVNGSFGMAKETGLYINQAITKGAALGRGLGESVAEMIAKKKLPYRDLSILYWAHKLNIPVCVHVAIGTDIIHQHPTCDGAAIGKASLCDFHKLVDIVSNLKGGVVVNIGSTVIMPEVFLKALTTARNIGNIVKDFTTVNFDMSYHYRPAQNIVRRPVLGGGKGYYIIGHHEIMIPLLYQALQEEA